VGTRVGAGLGAAVNIEVAAGVVEVAFTVGAYTYYNHYMKNYKCTVLYMPYHHHHY
jgi:hypothetical protein